MPAINYQSALEAILDPIHNAGDHISAAELFAHPTLGTAKDATKMKHLKAFLSKNITYLGCVRGVLPTPEAIIALAEDGLGQQVVETNVVEANRLCAAIVEKAAKPLLEEVVSSGLSSSIDRGILTITLDELIDFLIGDYATFTKGAGNGLVSIAGSLNEKLLIQCLVNKGFTEDQFKRTGTESEGDILVYGKDKVNLGIEVKSYHARERLLRGLRDVQKPKVGVGYFIDSREFNRNRTILLMDTQAAAVYMPTETLSQINEDARTIKTNNPIAFDSYFYRPIEQFASDMLHFTQFSKLPDYF